MEKPRIPEDEATRIAALEDLRLLDTPPEARFDRLTRIAQAHFDVPIALVSLVDTDRQWFKSCQGLDTPETSRDVSFCAHAILGDDIFCVPDTHADPRFADNPLVTGPPHIRFYAGAPVRAPGGERVGTLCLIDHRPRRLSAGARTVLVDLAACVEEEIGRTLLMDKAAALVHTRARLQGLFDLSPVGIALIDHDSGRILDANASLVADTGYSRPELLGLRYRDFRPPEAGGEVLRHLDSLRETGLITGYETEHLRKDGSRYPVVMNGMLVHEADGRKSIWLIIADISAQRELIDQSETQRRHLHSVLDQLRIGTLLLDRDGRVRFVNDYSAALGVDVRLAAGRHWSEALPIDGVQRTRLQAQMDADPADRGPIELSWRGAGPQHHYVECEVRQAPDEPEEMILCLTDITDLHVLQQQVAGSRFERLVGNTDSMRQLYGTIGDVARGDWTVLIEGETGAGKDLVAQAIHAASPRRDGPFIAVNAAGLSETLLASQLFGHRKGSFTGAVGDQEGLFEAASGGTLFLDEIGDLPLTMQASLLRVLQEKEIVRVGDTKPRKVDVRILAATHKDLSAEVAGGRFRQDLLYRLRVARVQVPALRDRLGDIPLLAEGFLREAAPIGSPSQPRCSPAALRLLMSYDWPGNVRELKSALDHAVIRARTDIIEPADLPPEIRGAVRLGAGSVTELLSGEVDERQRILAALEKTGGNCSRAAELLNISRATLYRHMARLNVSPREATRSRPVNGGKLSH